MYESGIRLTAVDLNLLVVFDAVMLERNVTRAGARVGLSQPAVSHALSRLRRMLKDDLFVRGAHGMVPTPRAEELAVSVREALGALQRSLQVPHFDPVESSHSFRVAVENYAAVVLVGLVAADIAEAAPRVAMLFRPTGSLDIPGMLDRDEIDLAIGPFTTQGARFESRQILDDVFVAVVRKNHPALRGGELALADFARLGHLQITSVMHSTDFVDAALAERGLSRRIVLHVPLLSARQVLEGSDMVAVLPRRIALEMWAGGSLVLARLPHPSPGIETSMIWPKWLDRHPAHRWLRQRIALIADRLAGAIPMPP